MKNKDAILHSFGHALLVLLYTSGVAWFLFNNQRFFGHARTFVVPLAMLLLLVLSATIVGALVLGRPAMLYLSGSKSEALKFFGYTVGWIFVITLTAFLLLSLGIAP